MAIKLLTEYHLEFLSLKGGCTESSGSTLVKMPHCCESHVAAHMYPDFGEQPNLFQGNMLRCTPTPFERLH